MKIFLSVCAVAFLLTGCASKQEIELAPPHTFLPQGASQMGSAGTGGQPLTAVSGDPHPYTVDFREHINH